MELEGVARQGASRAQKIPNPESEEIARPEAPAFFGRFAFLSAPEFAAAAGFVDAAAAPSASSVGTVRPMISATARKIGT